MPPFGHRASDAGRGALRSPVLRRQLGAFLTANVVCWAIWLATGAPPGVWPKWVLLGTGIAVVVTLIRVLVGPDEDEDEDEAEPFEHPRRPR